MGEFWCQTTDIWWTEIEVLLLQLILNILVKVAASKQTEVQQTIVVPQKSFNVSWYSKLLLGFLFSILLHFWCCDRKHLFLRVFFIFTLRNYLFNTRMLFCISCCRFFTFLRTKICHLRSCFPSRWSFFGNVDVKSFI